MAPPLNHLCSHLAIYQVFGANTDVGKTIFTTALALASAALSRKQGSKFQVDSSKNLVIPQDADRIHYVKPISTGPLRDSDSLHIKRFIPQVNAHTIYQFKDPVSPHVAASRATAYDDQGKALDTDDESVLHHLSKKLGSFAADQHHSTAFVETAGGVHSPGPSGTSFSSLLRPLRLPTMMIFACLASLP